MKNLYWMCYFLMAATIGIVGGQLIIACFGENINIDFTLTVFLIGIISYWGHSYLRYRIIRDSVENLDCEQDYEHYVADGMIAKDGEQKEIHFYKDYPYIVPEEILYITHNGTKLAIQASVKVIHTTALTMLSFDLLDNGYRIFLHENERVLECKPGMDGTEREVRRAHNILKMVVAGVFDEYFYENKTENDNESNDERCSGSEQENGENNDDNNQ